ncbi:MAG: hypothetical protein HY078_03635 [Elusimicrobia bacterium]|nr:hypothetical protein [Elusimicrobiota bacterium]
MLRRPPLLAAASAFALLCAPIQGAEDAFFSRLRSGVSDLRGRSSADVPAVGNARPASYPKAGRDSLLHGQETHTYITRKGIEAYLKRYASPELARYGEAVVSGSSREDDPFDNPWNQGIPVLRHFWALRGGKYCGMLGYDSSVNRAHKYFSGGYGMDGRFDSGWGGNGGKRAGKKGLGVIGLYRKDDKANAFLYLGQALHLLEDLTVPAHTHAWPHVVPDMDRYEEHLKTQYPRWSKLPESIESFATLYDLFENTGRITERYDAGFGPGPFAGVSGTVDRGSRRRKRFTKKDLDAEADVLMPLAFARAAALIRFFYSQVDRTPPRVTLAFPIATEASSAARAPSSRIRLKAEARDEASGVDRAGFSFEVALWSPDAPLRWIRAGKTGGPSALFEAAPGRMYAVRARAVDAAGNRGVSNVGYVIAGPAPQVLARFAD